MPTAVLDLDLDHIPAELTGIHGYPRALIMTRFHGCPVGQVAVSLRDGGLAGDALRRAVFDALDWSFWERWLHAYLGWSPGDRITPSPVTATVAVCTRDRPEDLRRCLEALMRLPDDGQEVLVIDNAPATEATRRLVSEYPRARYVLEPRPGLNVARNRALREARHEIVAFTDDDAGPDPGWLRALLRNFQDDLVLAATGLTMPLELETEAQEAFERHTPFGRGFRRTVFDGLAHDPLSVGRVGAGANMALHRLTLDLVGPFDEALDGGTPTRTGGDHEMFSRILAAGYRIVYDPAALSWHRHRRTREELRRTLFGYGTGVYAMWTRSLLQAGEWGVLKRAAGWFVQDQLPAVVRALLRRPGSTPLDLLLAELRGCLTGPGAYLASRRRLRGRAET